MEIIADLHLHSKYSRACSKELDIKNMEKYARIKGIGLLGTGDFQHPKWQTELKENLIEDDTGILKTKTGFPFLLSTEISLIYSQEGKGRKVHNIVLARDMEICSQISEALLKRGRIDYDGRPIFNISCPEFVELMKEIDENIEIIPAHAWTPWFSVFGSNSGFDSIEEAFQEKEKHIHAIETGLSSDPEMNWRLSILDKYSLVSFSDSHSYWPWRLGREATVFKANLDYESIIKAIRTKEGLSSTIEVDPAYGKYHYDGHRLCGVSLSPKEAIKFNKICPRCRKPLTIGVEHRVEELADRPPGFKPKKAVPFEKLLPLSELISLVQGKALTSKSVWEAYYSLVGKLGSEYQVLRKTSYGEIEKHAGKKLAELIIKNRLGQIRIKPGYDGNYGIPLLGNEEIKEKPPAQQRQRGLDEFFR